MAIEITIPPLGWSADDGIFSGWLKGDGDQVKPGDALFSLEGEKAVQEIESLDGGTLRILPTSPKVGDKVAVGLIIGYLLGAGETLPTDQAGESAPKPKSDNTSKPATPNRSHSTPSMRRQARAIGSEKNGSNGAEHVHQPSTAPTAANLPAPAAQRSTQTAPRTSNPNDAQPIASPRAKRVAAELGVDWTQLEGSGSTGRIRECDVRTATPATLATVAPMLPGVAGSRQVPVTTVRKRIAAKMLESAKSTAPVTLTTTFDVTNLVNLRNQFKELAQTGATQVPSYTDFLAKLVAVALQQHPGLNSRWNGDHIEILPTMNIGIAVDTEAGLFVPVLHDVSNMRLLDVVSQSRDLIARARQVKLTADDMQGGTFTITNLGSFGIDAFTPIINFPQAAILGVGRFRREPTVVDNQIVIRDVVTMSLTFDHRIVDGAPAARFLQLLGELVKNPGPCLTV